MTPWPRTGTMMTCRTRGTPFYCQDAETAPGFYRFVAPDDAEPIGPYPTAEIAFDPAGFDDHRLEELFR